MSKKHNILRNTYVLSALLALAVTLVINLCFMLFIAYGDYISGESLKDRQERREMMRQEHDMMPQEGVKGEMPHREEMRGDVKPGEKPEMMPKPDNLPEKPGVIPPHLFWNLLWNFLATYILFLANLKLLNIKCFKQWKKNGLALIVTLIWIALYTYIFFRVAGINPPEHPRMGHAFRGIMTVSAFNGVLVYFSSLLAFYFMRWHDTAIENEALRALNYSTQYEALKSKLDPHFLFNALNTLSGLIAINSTQTEAYIQKLSAIFRTTLKHDDVVSVEDEVEFTKAYGDLMVIRYDNSLNVVYEIPESIKKHRIVSFGIQTLLENAIKHNTITTKKPLAVSIGSEEGYVTVSNAKQPRKEVEAGNGLGLKLLSERCLAVMERDIVIIDDNENFTVKIPIDI